MKRSQRVSEILTPCVMRDGDREITIMVSEDLLIDAASGDDEASDILRAIFEEHITGERG